MVAVNDLLLLFDGFNQLGQFGFPPLGFFSTQS
jgi:hypothetical protein